ncbi:MAG: hypothetical protein DMG58_36580 [Acidobacteria bacterium]|nr:MAG: hypothetical protein DMG58_36580 [Acidobacteriota bacterium]
MRNRSNPAGVAKWLGVATRTLCLWAECKEIPGLKVGRQWRFREGELRKWLESPQASKVGINTNNRVSGATARVVCGLLPQLPPLPQQAHTPRTGVCQNLMLGAYPTW